jgi:hypothetical protein
VAVAKDLIVILAPVQAVLWPQMFFVLAYWPFEVVAALATMLVAWNLLIGAVVVLAIDAAAAATPGQSGQTRAAWMGAIIAVVALGPLIGLLAQPGSGPSLEDPGRVSSWALTSPVTAVFEIARDRPWTGKSAEASPAHWVAIWIVGGIGLLAWAAVLAMPRRASDGTPTPEPPGGMV